jgi:hypothetical protein
VQFSFFAVEQNQFESTTELNLSISNLQIQLLDQDGQPEENHADFSIVIELSTFHNPQAFAVASPLPQFLIDSRQQLIDEDGATDNEDIMQ